MGTSRPPTTKNLRVPIWVPKQIMSELRAIRQASRGTMKCYRFDVCPDEAAWIETLKHCKPDACISCPSRMQVIGKHDLFRANPDRARPSCRLTGFHRGTIPSPPHLHLFRCRDQDPRALTAGELSSPLFRIVVLQLRHRSCQTFQERSARSKGELAYRRK